MKIIYKYNPLKTVVEIEEKERIYLVNGILADDLTYYVADLKPLFEKDEKNESYEKIKKEIADFTFIDRLTEIAEKKAESYEAALKSHHVGDCIGVPCSCEKCWAENYLAIDTLSDFTDSEKKFSRPHLLYNLDLECSLLEKKEISSETPEFLDKLIEVFSEKNDKEDYKVMSKMLKVYRNRISLDKN